MTRVLIVCLLTVMLIQPVAAGMGASTDDQIAIRPHLVEAISRSDVSEAMAFWVRNHAQLLNIATRPISTNPSSFNKATGHFSQCSQKVALGPDIRCVGACDAAKESCDRQCSSVRATCLAQCLGLGFACDYYCHAAYFVCKANCGRAHDGCVSSCPTKGGEKES